MTDVSRPQVIAIEEHYLDDAVMKLSGGGGPPHISAMLSDLGEVRLREMDEAGVDIQVLSHCPPGAQAFEPFSESDDSLVQLAELFPDLSIEKLEGELQKQYAVYLERFRNLDYLQAELQTYHSAEKEEVNEHDRNLKRMQKRLREEELRILRGEQEPAGEAARKEVSERPTQARPARPRSRVDDSSEDIDSDEISRDSDSDSVSLAASSGAGSGIDEIDDDDSLSDDDGASSADFSVQSSDEF